jgi:hypothetical protein
VFRNRTALGLFCLVAGLWGLLCGCHFYTSDDRSEYLAIYNGLTGGTWGVDPVNGTPGSDGQRFSRYPPLALARLVPFIFAGLPVLPKTTLVMNIGEYPFGPLLLFGFHNVVYGALTVALLYLCSNRIYSRNVSLVVALSLLATTLGLAYKQTMSEPLQGLLLVLSLRAILAERFSSTAFTLPLAACFLVRNSAIGYIAGGFVLLLALRRWRAAVELAGWSAVSALLWMAYNVYRFGDPLSSGYVSAWDTFPFDVVPGFVHLTLSPGRGLFFYSPILLLGLLGLPALWRRHREAAAFIAAMVGGGLALFCCWNWTAAGGCYGPRYIIPLCPLLLLPLGEWLPGRKGLVAALLAVSVLFHLPGYLISPVDYLYRPPSPTDMVGFNLTEKRISEVNWTFSQSSIVGCTRVVLGRMGYPQLLTEHQRINLEQVQPDFYWWRYRRGKAATIVGLFLVLQVGLMVFGLWLLCRSAATPTDTTD